MTKLRPSQKRARVLAKRYGRSYDLPTLGVCGMCGAQVIYAMPTPKAQHSSAVGNGRGLGMVQGFGLDATPLPATSGLVRGHKSKLRVLRGDGYAEVPRFADQHPVYREHSCHAKARRAA